MAEEMHWTSNQYYAWFDLGPETFGEIQAVLEIFLASAHLVHPRSILLVEIQAKMGITYFAYKEFSESKNHGKTYFEEPNDVLFGQTLFLEILF